MTSVISLETVTTQILTLPFTVQELFHANVEI